MFVLIVVVVSLLCQAAAAWVALRIASRFRPGWGWLLLALAMVLMVVRSLSVLGEIYLGIPRDLISESVALLISLTCLAGVLLIEPVLKAAYRYQTFVELETHRLSGLLQCLPGAVYQCRNDPQWTMQYINDGCRELTGYAPEDLIGNRRRAYAELIVPEDREKVWQEVQKAVNERRPYRLVYRIRTASGDVKWVWEQGMAVFDEEGEVAFLTGYITDVTTWRRIEEELEQARQEWHSEKEVWRRTEKRLLNEVWELQERQNEAIAYEIHDGFIQQATGALMSLETYRHLRSTAPQEAESFLDRAMHLIRNAIAEARRLIRGLRPDLLEEGGLIPALQSFFQEIRARHNVEIEFHNQTQFIQLAAPVETHIFRIIQEAVLNAVRHSGSSRVAVSLRQQNSTLEIEVRDWGTGFDVERIPAGHFGLHSIRDRAKLLGGWAEITSQRQRGTTVRVTVPLDVLPTNGIDFDPYTGNPLVPTPSSNG
ncbi:PAS domain-containing protein [Thermogutta sp.]|jgi:PAS domain S-box-containing protein|uniref:sensor histidine kinase n=1 Tax=Thermogutta sp. TaxID=1962930 RepID=UPI00321FFDC7